ncbi:SYS1 [Salix koriyanagi]|uniref:SYS1 n=1 Tax=Salix koriyanagi TaxID=2511006 RepID=A0A9Q0SZW8_9ROSI|nr:SYS1 [Salix koriyanagi]
MFYGASVWDPWLIVAQIVCLQCLYYLTLGFFLSFLVGTRVSHLTLVYFFDFATITTSTVTGCCVIASLLLTSFAGAGYMVFLIERAKKCLDFSATLYIIHLFKCIIYGGWPSSISWWVVNGTGFAVMALLGEYLCIKRELREIPIARSRSILCPDLWEDEFLWGVNNLHLVTFPMLLQQFGLEGMYWELIQFED